MKSYLLVALSAQFMSANAHYFFDRLLVNGEWSEPWEYTRYGPLHRFPLTAPWSHQTRSSPVVRTTDSQLDSKIKPQGTAPSVNVTDYDYIVPVVLPTTYDLRCGRDAWSHWTNKPKTAVIHAGDTVGFAVNTTVGLPIPDAPVNPWDRWPNMYHPGPATAWLSKSEGPLNDYWGDGDWFKILSVVNRTEQSVPPDDNYTWKHQWGTYEARNWTFTIPDATPPGEYLLRFEHIYPLPTTALQGSQFYVNCAHIKIINDEDDAGTPGPLVKIPGVYTWGQKEIYFYADVGNETYNIRDFVEPQPPVWTG